MRRRYDCGVYLGEMLAAYGFGESHPFSNQRHSVFERAFYAKKLDKKAVVLTPKMSNQETLELFHQHDYVELVKRYSLQGEGYLDQGDTPAFVGMYEAGLAVVGSVCDAIDRIMASEYRHAFVPIAGLHHARRDGAAGFCVFNDCGVAIEYLRHRYNIQRIAYVDIDAHHGDGVFYSFEADPDLIFADIHEDGRFLYPGTGTVYETGIDAAKGTKLNIPMDVNSNDKAFMEAWQLVEDFVLRQKADFILLQCGADSIDGDPLTHLRYSEKAHAYAAKSLASIAETICDGRLLALGGGGYDHNNIGKTWTAVVESLS